MHASLFVIGPNPEAQLVPFNENLKGEYNPRGKWDWFVFGGGWEHRLLLKDGNNVNTARAGSINWERMNGYCEDDFTYWPFAILADGAWQAREEFMWDAENETGEYVTHFTEEDWREHCYQFLSRLAPDTLVTLIDYHH